MSQRKISSFFNPGVKRTASGANFNEAPPKKIRTAENNEVLISKIKEQSQKTPALSDNIGLSWFEALHKEFDKPYFLELSRSLTADLRCSIVYPPADEVYTWTQLCEIDEVKVVIMGQDPYHGPGQAHGLAFSVSAKSRIPPSLQNIYKELAADIESFKSPSHGYLKGWATQGVLLLNTCLTVRRNQPKSHNGYGWETFTKAIVKWINDNLNNIVFLLWGADAKKFAPSINEKKHLVLMAPHPSPFSARYGFFGSHHFSKTNQYLEEKKKSPIDWSHLPK